MENARILLVDDDPDVLQIVSHHLSRNGYRVSVKSSSEEALEDLKHEHPDLIISDILLPGQSGVEFCREIRSNEITASIPFIMLTVKDADSDQIKGLEVGADDYLTKPFNPGVMLARVQALLRRKTQTEEPMDAPVTAGELMLDPVRQKATLSGEQLSLTKTEFSLLHLLARHPGRVFSRADIVNSYKKNNKIAGKRAVDFQITGIRKKLGTYGNYIETVRGVGYRFAEV